MTVTVACDSDRDCDRVTVTVGYWGFAPGPQGPEPLEKKKGDEESDDRKSAMDPRSHRDSGRGSLRMAQMALGSV